MQNQKRKINKNLSRLVKSKRDNIRGTILAGSSRSGKTIASIDFIILLCTRYETKCTINIIKETFQSFKTTLYRDFDNRLTAFGLYSPFADKQEVATFKIFGNTINFLGADKPSKFQGAQCDYLYINEGIFVGQKVFDQAEMRCIKMFWIDYNPSVSEHYIYDTVIPRDDVAYLHSTFKDNPFISKGELNKILSYNPSNEANARQGTADKFMWDVYGLGIRGVLAGLVYGGWKQVAEFPKHLDPYYGVDFGWNDPMGAVRMAFDEKTNTVFIKQVAFGSEISNQELAQAIKLDYWECYHCYYEDMNKACYSENSLIFVGEESFPMELGVHKSAPFVNSLKNNNFTIADTIAIQKQLGIVLNYDVAIYCDGAEPKSIRDLRNCGLSLANAAPKGKGSKLAGIKLLKGVNVCYTADSTQVKKSVNSYKWKEKPKSTQEPDSGGGLGDDTLHYMSDIMDAIRYGFYGHVQYNGIVIE